MLFTAHVNSAVVINIAYECCSLPRVIILKSVNTLINSRARLICEKIRVVMNNALFPKLCIYCTAVARDLFHGTVIRMQNIRIRALHERRPISLDIDLPPPPSPAMIFYASRYKDDKTETILRITRTASRFRL